MILTAMFVCLYCKYNGRCPRMDTGLTDCSIPSTDVPMLAWVLRYFQGSFSSPLPWAGRVEEFYTQDVTAYVEPVGGEFNDDGSIASYTSYPGVSVIPETAAWTFFAWFVIWLSLAKGIATTGKVVYFTMISLCRPSASSVR